LCSCCCEPDAVSRGVDAWPAPVFDGVESAIGRDVLGVWMDILRRNQTTVALNWSSGS
jgi:hypothetical protein